MCRGSESTWQWWVMVSISWGVSFEYFSLSLENFGQVREAKQRNLEWSLISGRKQSSREAVLEFARGSSEVCMGQSRVLHGAVASLSGAVVRSERPSQEMPHLSVLLVVAGRSSKLSEWGGTLSTLLFWAWSATYFEHTVRGPGKWFLKEENEWKGQSILDTVLSSATYTSIAAVMCLGTS